MIDIATVLAKFNDTYDEDSNQEKYYGIRFLTRSGNTHEVEVRKYVKSPQLKQVTQDPKGKRSFNLKEHGVMMCIEYGAEKPISPKVCMIYGFRDYNSTVWHSVFH